MTAEGRRLDLERKRRENWKRWGPYVSERQWGTVREDYSTDGAFWHYFPHDHARSRAYRWGEDGLLGWCDRQCRLCFALSLWNGRDPILKERLFGLSNPQGNHGEDVKEIYQYLDATPTYSYCRAMYRYPQAAFPYQQLIDENGRRGRRKPEFELVDTGVFDDSRFWDIQVEYTKAAPNDILIRLTVTNHGPEAATLHLIPTLWFRNTWSWGCRHEGCTLKPHLRLEDEAIAAEHDTLGRFALHFADGPDGQSPDPLFTDNHTNRRRLFDAGNETRFVKDAFHEYIVAGSGEAVNPKQTGTKAGLLYQLNTPARGQVEVRLRLRSTEAGGPDAGLGRSFVSTMSRRRREASEYNATTIPEALPDKQRDVAHRALAGLLWSKQFYHYVVEDWLDGDPNEPSPHPQRRAGPNADWPHLFNRDVISVPDKWEFPWYASWDLGFQMIPMAQVDPDFAKKQCMLFLREWYMHPNGQLPAYEMNLNDTNPPVHAWACRRVFEIDAARHGTPDHDFLARCFQKLLLNFTWWVNRKDTEGRNIFSGGFLGLDNIAVIDRSELPPGVRLEQADATAWMGFYCAHMLGIALELAQVDSVYEDLASKFFEHFIAVCDAINTLGGHGLWDDQAGLYRDEMHIDGRNMPLPVRSIVGLLPIAAVEVLKQSTIDRLPGFKKRMNWFLENRVDLARHVSYLKLDTEQECSGAHRLLAIPSEDRLRRAVALMMNESEFLSPFGVRSLSRWHEQHPFTMHMGGASCRVAYEPGESQSTMFGGNSNWRGPIWLPINYLFIHALRQYGRFYGDRLTVPNPNADQGPLTLNQAADEIASRCLRLFMPSDSGTRPCNQALGALADRDNWHDMIFFHEYFHADTGKGLGASHQLGWTSLIASLLIEGGGPQTGSPCDEQTGDRAK